MLVSGFVDAMRDTIYFLYSNLECSHRPLPAKSNPFLAKYMRVVIGNSAFVYFS